MKRFPPSARRGIALVITLIMLSVVTITAVAFLALSRRERGSVTAASDQIDARHIASAGLARASAEAAAVIVGAGDTRAIRLKVSTNFINPLFRLDASFVDQADFNQLTNVNYLKNPASGTPFDLGRAADRSEYVRMLANLFYDPRPPVYVQTNNDPRSRPENRFYLDLNRNGRYESNGLVWPTDRYGKTNGFAPQFMVGDPEWIGVLEHPDAPYSGTNLFKGRFAYVIVPDSVTLDINFIHNKSKLAHGLVDSTNNSAYYRNQGAGSWELNLGGFFADLNTNIWGVGYPPYYNYSLNPGVGSSGAGLADASVILGSYRYAGGWAPQNAINFFVQQSGVRDRTIATRFPNEDVDWYAQGPIATTPEQVIQGVGPTTQNPGVPWVGSDATNYLTDINQLFNASLGLGQKLAGVWPQTTPRTSTLSTYDNYTWYRLMAQLGVDGADGRFEYGFNPGYAYPGNPSGFYRRAKLNLNYALDYPDGVQSTNAEVSTALGLRDWTPIHWFTNAANRLLLSEFAVRPDFTNGLPFVVRDGSGNQVRINQGLPLLGVETVTANRQTYLSNHTYTAEIHRPLQLAANIYDFTTNRVIHGLGYPYPPTIFRPLVYRDRRTPGVLRLGGFEEVTNLASLSQRWWLPSDPATLRTPPPVDPNTLPVAYRDALPMNIYGIPWVVGAKKGLPGFNEAFWQTGVQATRRLIITKPRPISHMSASEYPFPGLNGEGFQTFAQYQINLTNVIGVDAWNSYTNPYPRAVTIVATNFHQFAIRAGNPTNGPILTAGILPMLVGNAITLPAGGWKKNEHIGAINTNLVYNFLYNPALPRLFPVTQGTTNTVYTQVGVPLPPLTVTVTNSLVFAISDVATGRLLDVVTLRSQIFETNLFGYFGATNPPGTITVPTGPRRGGGAGTLTMADFWNPTPAQGFGTVGVQNQFLVSSGARTTAAALWVDATGGPVNVQDVAKSISGLNFFLYQTIPAGTPAQIAQLKQSYEQVTAVQVGFNPSPSLFLTDRRMANDPLVHYTLDDLQPGYSVFSKTDGSAWVLNADGNRVRVGATTNVYANQIGLQTKVINAYAPWGGVQNLGLGAATPIANTASPAYDMAYKDPLITGSDAWRFPTNSAATGATRKFANIGEIGQVHRGTPWQTVYLKSDVPPGGTAQDRVNSGIKSWFSWNGSPWNHPTNDWRYFDLFTTALNDNAARGLMGVGQTNLAAWSALVSGVPVFDNRQNVNNLRQTAIQPNSTELTQLVGGYTNAAGAIIPGVLGTMTNPLVAPGGRPATLGAILGVPTLSTHSPFLNIPTNVVQWRVNTNLTDEVVERIPQQVLSLLRADEPRFTVYSFGQTLKPALNSLVTKPGQFFGIATNYQVTGEYATKTVMRFDGPTNRLVPVIEDHRVLYPAQ